MITNEQPAELIEVTLPGPVTGTLGVHIADARQVQAYAYNETTFEEEPLHLYEDYTLNVVGLVATYRIINETFWDTGGYTHILFVRSTRADQVHGIEDGRRLNIDLVERTLDTLTMTTQEAVGAARRSLRTPFHEATLTIPAVADRASMVLRFDALGQFALEAPGASEYSGWPSLNQATVNAALSAWGIAPNAPANPAGLANLLDSAWDWGTSSDINDAIGALEVSFARLDPAGGGATFTIDYWVWAVCSSGAVIPTPTIDDVGAVVQITHDGGDPAAMLRAETMVSGQTRRHIINRRDATTFRGYGVDLRKYRPPSTPAIWLSEYQERSNLERSAFRRAMRALDGDELALGTVLPSRRWTNGIWVDWLGLFILIGRLTATVAWSADGVTWNSNPGMGGDTDGGGIDHIESAGMVCVAVVSSGSGLVYSAPDGTTYTNYHITSFPPTDVVAGAGAVMFLVFSAGYISRSSDGVNWTDLVQSHCGKAAWSEELGIFVTFNSTAVLTSDDGVTWNSHAGKAPAYTSVKSVKWIKDWGMFIAHIYDGTTRKVYGSEDGIDWTLLSSDSYSGDIVSWDPIGGRIVISDSGGTAIRIGMSPTAWIDATDPVSGLARLSDGDRVCAFRKNLTSTSWYQGASILDQFGEAI